MTMYEYLKRRGLMVKTVAQHLGVSSQAISQMGIRATPTAKTLRKVAAAMTELGAPTTVVDLTAALYGE